MQSPSSKRPFVSVVIPCRNEEAHIHSCLESILAQTYPRSRMEILVIDGLSTDRTREIIQQITVRHPSALIRVLDNPEHFQAPGCNRAIAQCHGDVIARMDAHAEYHPEYIERAVAALAATGAANVGCAARPFYSKGRVFQHALTIALKSRFAMGGASYWQDDREGWVDTVWNGVFPRATFEEVGMFDARARTNEDAELNLRITKAGRRVFLCRSMIANYYPRTSAASLARQYFRYGHGRARTILKHRALQSYRPLAPALLLLALASLALLSFFFSVAGLALAALAALYSLAILFESTQVSFRNAPRLAPLVTTILPIMHFSHGLGFLTGLVRYTVRADWTPAPDLLRPRDLPLPLESRFQRDVERAARTETSPERHSELG